MPPERIGPDEERAWLLGKLALARTLQRMQPDAAAPGEDAAAVLAGMARALRVHEVRLRLSPRPPRIPAAPARCAGLL